MMLIIMTINVLSLLELMLIVSVEMHDVFFHAGTYWQIDLFLF